MNDLAEFLEKRKVPDFEQFAAALDGVQPPKLMTEQTCVNEETGRGLYRLSWKVFGILAEFRRELRQLHRIGCE